MGKVVGILTGALAGVLAGVLVTGSLAGCSGDKVTDSSSVAPMLLTDRDTPEGYTWNSVAEVLRDADDGLGNQLDASANATTTQPASCAALVPTSDSIIAELYGHRDSTGAVEFLPRDSTSPAVIDAVVSTADDGDTSSLATGKVTVSDCAEFTRTGSDGTVTTYRATSQKASLATTDDTTVFTVSSDSVNAGESLVITVAGTVDGVHFRVTAAAVSDVATLTDLAEKQVSHIGEVMEGQD